MSLEAPVAPMNEAERTTGSVTVRQLRLLFAEYKNVVMGLTVLSKKVFNRSDSGAPRLGLQLRRLQERLSRHRRAIFQLEVNDAYLVTLLSKIRDDECCAAEVKEFAARIALLRHLLASLASWVEKGQVRHSPPVAVATIDGNLADRQLNRQLLAYEIVLGRTVLQSAPLRHSLDIMSRCNLRCLTCHQSANQDLISFDIADAPLEVLLPGVHLADEVNITGIGETLLSRAAPAVVAAYKQAGAYVILQTNGTMAARLAALAPKVDAVWLSFDGGTAESYNLIRRWGDHQALVASLAALPVEERRKVALNFVVCKQNIRTIEACLDMAVELQLGQVHFQEMTAYLPWHDRMQIDDDDRNYFFENFPRWRAKAMAGDVHTRCNLTAPATTSTGARSRLVDTAISGVADLSNIPLPKGPARRDADEISVEIDRLADTKVPDFIAELGGTAADVNDNEIISPPQDLCADGHEFYDAVAEAHAMLKERLANGERVRLPHCLAAYADFVLNDDGTTRACCNMQSSLATLYEDRFADIRNSPAYQELRYHHSQHVAPQGQCVDCRDPMRFFHLPEILETLNADGIGLSLIEKPRDFPLPADIAAHRLVRQLGPAVPRPETKPASRPPRRAAARR